MHPRGSLPHCGGNRIEKSDASGEGSTTAQRRAINWATIAVWEPEKKAGKLPMPAAKPKSPDWKLNPNHMDFRAKRTPVFRIKNAD